MNQQASNCPFPQGSLVDLYVRCSTGDQKIDSQLSFLRDWFSEQHLIVGEIFTDEAKSGTSVAGRGDFLRMMDKLRRLAHCDAMYSSPHPAGVAFWDFKRFGRDYDDSQYFRSELRRLGYVVHSVTDNIPPGLLGRLVEAVHDYKNALFIQELRADIVRELNHLTSQGYLTGGTPPVGFKRSAPVSLGRKKNGDPKLAYRMEIDPAAETVLRKAWEMKLAGATHREIHAATRLFGNVQHYSKCFANPAYAGAVASGSVTTWDAHAGYITRGEFDAVQLGRKPRAKKGEVLQDTSRHGARRKQNNPFLLSGLLECGMCGYLMSGTSNKFSRLYRCDWQHRRLEKRMRCEQPSILAAAVHAPLIEWLATDVFTYESLQEVRDEANAELNGKDPETEQRCAVLESHRERVTGAIDNLTNAIEQRGYVPQLQARLDERLAELRAIEGELLHLHTKRQARGVNLTDAGLRVLAESIRERLRRFLETNAADVRNVLREIVARAELQANALIVHYSVYPVLMGNEIAAVRRGLYSPQYQMKTHVLTLERPLRGRIPLDASPYLPLVLNAVREGVVTARGYADRQNISINTASFHYAEARRAKVIEPLGRFADGIHYRAVGEMGSDA